MMTDQELEQKLARAARNAAPDDIEAVLSRCQSERGTIVMMKEKKHSARRYLAAAACLALLLVGGGTGALYQQVHAVASVVSLDVNPSIELKVNKQQKVLSCTGLNEKARQVLDDMGGGADLKGTKLDVAVNALVGALVRSGYLDDISSAILISVEDKNTQRAEQLEQQLLTSVDEVLQQRQSQATVIGQVVSGGGERKEGVSSGKSAMVEKLVAMNPELSSDRLAELSAQELYYLSVTGAKAMPIGKDGALAAALAYAGAGAGYEIDADVDPELDENPAVYEVELYHGVLGELTYRVDAFTGKVVSGEKDAMKNAPANPAQISRSQAEDAALSHAKVARADANAIFAKKDMEHGKILWEIEFYANGREYEYELDAVTGQVVSFESEPDQLGVIGGADGPTGILIEDDDDEDDDVDEPDDDVDDADDVDEPDDDDDDDEDDD